MDKKGQLQMKIFPWWTICPCFGTELWVMVMQMAQRTYLNLIK